MKAPEFRRLVEEEIRSKGDRSAAVLRKIEIAEDDDRRLFPTDGFAQLLQDPEAGAFLQLQIEDDNFPFTLAEYRQRLILGGRVADGRQIGNVGEQCPEAFANDPRILDDDDPQRTRGTYGPDWYSSRT